MVISDLPEVPKAIISVLATSCGWSTSLFSQQKETHFILFTLYRKVLNKLNFSIPEEVIRKIVQCSPGVVELVLIPLRQKIEEKQKQSKQTNSYQVSRIRETAFTITGP